MSNPNCDILREEMGDEDYTKYVKNKIEAFNFYREKDVEDIRTQMYAMLTSLLASAGVLVAYKKESLTAADAASLEACIIIISGVVYFACQFEREHYRKKMQEILSTIKKKIPEKCQLLSEAAFRELDADESLLADSRLSPPRIAADFTLKTAIEKIVPYIAAFFS